MNKSLLTSNNSCWRTPQHIIARIEKTFGSIGVDPCPDENPEVSVSASCVNLRRPRYDGLKESWTGWAAGQHYPLIFVNPPYGRTIAQWVSKCYEEARCGGEIIALIPARTDTRYFPWSASSLLFWKGRIKFLDNVTGKPGDPAPFPSVIAYWGWRSGYFRLAFEGCGHVVTP